MTQHADTQFTLDFESLCSNAIRFAPFALDNTGDKDAHNAAFDAYFESLQACMASAPKVFDKPRAYLYDALKQVLAEAKDSLKSQGVELFRSEKVAAFTEERLKCVKQEIAKPHYMPPLTR